MRKFWLVVTLCTIMGGLNAATVWAEESQVDHYVMMLRSDLKAEKAAIIVKNMHFTEAETNAFWPVYQQYQKELSKVGDEKVALIKDYAAHLDKIDEQKAKELTTKAMTVEEQRLQVVKKYIDEFTKVLPARQVARFFQLEMQMQRIIDIQVASELPLMQ
jgi:Na+(H+)/acetate symporter ActP